jgi:hypothetical protein
MDTIMFWLLQSTNLDKNLTISNNHVSVGFAVQYVSFMNAFTFQGL